MNQKLRNQLLFFGSTAVLGVLSMGLYGYMLANCFDEKGLLIAGNLPGKLLWAVGLAYGLVLALTTRTIGGDGTFGENFSRCLLRGGMMTAAGGLLVLTVPELGLEPVWKLALGYAAAVCMVWLGLRRMLGRGPLFGPAGVVCLFFMVLLVHEYGQWSASPKTYLYAYRLLALVLSMLCAFHRTCCDASIIQRRKLLLTAFAGAFCAINAMVGAPQPMLYGLMALWNLGAACTTGVLPADVAEEV